MSRPLSSGLVVPVAAGASWSSRGCACARPAGRALPAHVTALWPFLPVEALDDAVERRLEALLAGGRAPSRSRWSVSPTWRTPSSSCPRPPSRSARSPACCGTSGPSAHRSAAPSTTSRRTVVVIDPSAAERAAVYAALSPHLPLAARAAEVLLVEETGSGPLRVRRSFALGA